jgi:choline dehydrogenase
MPAGDCRYVIVGAGSAGCVLANRSLQPHSRGHVGLATADAAEPPIIDPGYLTAESDLPPLIAGIRIAERLCETDALRPYIGQPMALWPGTVGDEHLARYVRERASTAYHPVGSCRMGIDDAAVVDCELRVHGLNGLRVVDASVIPRITRGHRHAPTVMIAERAAELIRAGNHLPLIDVDQARTETPVDPLACDRGVGLSHREGVFGAALDQP